MKGNEMDFKAKCSRYSDLSSDSDHLLRLISSLLLKVNDTIEVQEARTLGFILDQYLNDKIIIDHVFWERSLEFWGLNMEESNKKIDVIKLRV